MKENMWNPWHGCHKVSEGCKNCYMFTFDEEREIDSSLIHKTKDFYLPVKKDRYGNFKLKDGQDISTCLTSDFFIAEADEWRAEAWKIIRKRPLLNFLIFTKRIERVKDCLPSDWNDGYDNVSIVLTTENQLRADERIPIFLELPIKHRILTVSPILEKLNIRHYLETGNIEKVFCSGENYKNARPCYYEWIKYLSEQCQETKTRFNFFHTGSKFIKDGRIYYIPYNKGKEQAKKAKLDIF